MARYPFLPQAKPAIKEHMDANEVDLESLVDTDWLDAVRVRARVRLVELKLDDSGWAVAMLLHHDLN